MAKEIPADGVNALVGDGGRRAVEPVPEPEQAAPPAPPPAPAPAPEPEPEPEPEQPGPVMQLHRLIADLNVDETVALVESGRYPARAVLTAERATKNRSTVIDALTRRSAPARPEES